MSLGEHLEELRKRILQGLLGFIAAGVVCAIDPGAAITAAHTIVMGR